VKKHKNLLICVKQKLSKRCGLLDNPNNLREILSNKHFSKFGDSIVNFIYNAAVFEISQKSKGIKVWDSCLAQACRNSQLRGYLGTRKSAGDIGDAVEAFIAFIYLKNKNTLPEMITILTKNLRKSIGLFQENEKELCTESFTLLINHFCKKLRILPD